jgi:hypothetical protein
VIIVLPLLENFNPAHLLKLGKELGLAALVRSVPRWLAVPRPRRARIVAK